MRHERIKSDGTRESNRRAHIARTVTIWWGLRSIFFSSLVVLLVGNIIFAAVYPTRNDEKLPLVLMGRDRESLFSNPAGMAPSSVTLCDVFSGRWVFDNASRPLYKEGECKHRLNQLACGKFGRKDLKYQQWRWQPHGCDLPRFNATALLERLRNRRLMFVGDSLNRSQWVSLLCMVQSSIPKKRRSVQHSRPLIVFNAHDYNATIEFYWAPLLVESNCDDPVNHRIDDRIVRVRDIGKHARYWSDVDILVFDSYLWWRQGPKIKVSWGSAASPDRKYEMVKMTRAYKIALNTWSDSIKVHRNRSKTQVFFMGLSPTHERAKDWGGIAGHNCYEETEPITKEGYRGSGSDRRMMQMLQKAINKLQKRGLNVHVLNITQLSEYRKDAHSSIHKKQSRNLTSYQIANPFTYADCFHWCLPGLPDVWNELLYAYILHN
ncbi:protein trichome birefringence-like 34 [Syzygium oleosum]|uniref:protein trichome birefringence-like 34 n=1 Tax=Syzygium oleosum TaxID=219896 RepID=UPI0024BB401A|nr:protein trichome birefringence-like 34 [Syzygium oleosum]